MTLTEQEREQYLIQRLREVFELEDSVTDETVLMSTQGTVTRSLIQLGISTGLLIVTIREIIFPPIN